MSVFFVRSSIQSQPSLPLWLQGAAVNEWVEIDGTALTSAQSGFTSPGGAKTHVCAYSGGAVQASGSVVWIFGGGHQDYAGNEPYTIRLADDVPAWLRRRDPTASVQDDVEHYADGRPSSRHSYFQPQFINALSKFFCFGGASTWGSGNSGSLAVDAFDPTGNDWDAAGTYDPIPAAAGSACGVCKDGDENVYIHNYGNGALYKWTRSTGEWSTLSNIDVGNLATSFCVDTSRNRILRHAKGGVSASVIALSNGAKTDISLTGDDAAQIVNGNLVYDPIVDCFWFWKWDETTLWKIHPTTWAVTVQSVTGSVPNNTFVDGVHEFYGRFNYCPELKGLVFVKDASANVHFLRTA
jgi:hypothetical protein